MFTITNSIEMMMTAEIARLEAEIRDMRENGRESRFARKYAADFQVEFAASELAFRQSEAKNLEAKAA